MNVPCPIHGSKRAHRGCHQCRRPICRLCELKMRGHLYCSPRCARNAGRDDLKMKVRESLGRPVSARFAVVIVLLACSAPGVLALRTVAELEKLNSPSSLPPRRASLARIERVVPGADGARIEGTAPSGAAVFLFAEGRFAATGLAADGRFRFEGVKVGGPYRVGALPLAAAEGSATASSAAPAKSAPPPAPADLREPPVPPERRVGDLAPVPRRAPVPDLSRGPRDRRDVLVSFDAGSSDRGAREILAALREHRIQTTIFLTGDFIRKYPDLTRRIAADGHEVGNHTETHPHLTTYARDGRQATRPGVDRTFLTGELSRTARLYQDATGRTLAPVWRAPFGEQNEEIRRWAAEAGYWHVGWTGGRAGLDGLDWISDARSRAYRTSDRVVQALVERAENGGIVLLHLGSDREDPVAPKISLLLDGLSARGFRFAKASEFLAREGMTEARLATLRLLPADRSGSAASR